MDAANSQIQSILKEIDLLFEPSPDLHILLTADEESLLAESEDGHVTADLITYVGRVLRRLKGRRELDAVLNSHPRLGASKVDSAHSRAEQASLGPASSGVLAGQNGTADEEAKQLQSLNEEYESVFPGLRYVVFVNGRSRAIIMEDMKRRIERGNIDDEREEAITAMTDIARNRLANMRSA